MMKKPLLASLASVPVTAPYEPTPKVVQRESLHVRIPVETAERIREAAHRTRREKQEITNEALQEWLAARGY